MPKFNTYVAVHKDPAETVWFAPGDEAPEWAIDLVGEHVFEGNEDDAEDVRLTDPQYEEDDVLPFSPNTLPINVSDVQEEEEEEEEEVDEDEAEEEEESNDLDYNHYTKAELIELAQSEGLDTSGTKADLIERLTA